MLKPTIYAYLRVSRDSQDTANQLHGVNAYAESAHLPQPIEVHDTASGAVPWRQRSLLELLDRAQTGDTVLVSEISRLARSTIQVLEVMQYATNKGIKIYVVKSGLSIDGSIMGNLMATFLGAFAEMERDLIRSRTSEALARRKENGLPMGRPPGVARILALDARAADIDKWMALPLGKRSIARLLDVQPATLYSWLRRRRGWTGKKRD